MQDDRVLGCILTDVSRAVVDEIQLAQRFAAAVKPQIAAKAAGTFVDIAFRHDKAVRLYRAVDLRHITANDEAGGGRPRRLAGRQLIGPLNAGGEDSIGSI